MVAWIGLTLGAIGTGIAVASFIRGIRAEGQARDVDERVHALEEKRTEDLGYLADVERGRQRAEEEAAERHRRELEVASLRLTPGMGGFIMGNKGPHDATIVAGTIESVGSHPKISEPIADEYLGRYEPDDRLTVKTMVRGDCIVWLQWTDGRPGQQEEAFEVETGPRLPGASRVG